MITFGYRNRFNGPLRALTALAVGLVMVISKTNALVLAVRIIAAFLLASGLVSVLVGYKERRNGQMSLMSVNAIVDLVLAIFMFVWPGVVAGLIVTLIGIALICFGLFQIVVLASANRVMNIGAFAFILPAVVLIGGAILVAKPGFIGSAIGVVAGVVLIIYGASELLSSWKMNKAMAEYESEPTDVPADEQVSGQIDEQ
ncbi:MAG: DUF308 domain-containing protein [Bacteroidales bacterium]|nr:DUF308 domain-containing protein [Bacteroidales bacterium]